MALRSSSLSQVNISEKTERERNVIAKEVIVKSLLPVVFEEVEEEEREEVFDQWFDKLFGLICGKGEIEEELEKAADSQREVVKIQSPRAKNTVSEKATERQMKKIWAVAHKLDYGKEDIERVAGSICNTSKLSELDKWQASKVIDGLLAELGVQEVYG